MDAAEPKPALTRRSFLWLGGAAAAAAAIGGDLLIRHAGRYGPAPIPGELRFLSNKEAHVLLAAVPAVLLGTPRPPSGPPLSRVVGRIDAWIARNLAGAPSSDATDIHRLLWLVEHGTALLRWGDARFTRLGRTSQAGYLAAWSTSRFSALAMAHRGLAQIAALGYYGHPESWRDIGYEGPMIEPGYDVWEHGG